MTQERLYGVRAGTGGRRIRVLRYTPYLQLFREPEDDTHDTPPQATQARL